MTELCCSQEFDEKDPCGYRLVKSNGRTICLNEQTPHEKVWISKADGMWTENPGHYEYRRIS